MNVNKILFGLAVLLRLVDLKLYRHESYLKIEGFFVDGNGIGVANRDYHQLSHSEIVG